MSGTDNPAHQAALPGQTVIHRKAKEGLAEHQARAMSLAKALRLTLAKVADELFDMSMAAIGVRIETRSDEELKEQLATPGLRMLLEGPMRSRAAAILDAPLVGGLIQQQTMGNVLAASDIDDRDFTPTDAAICAPFIDMILARSCRLPERLDDQRLIEGFHFGAWVEDERVLGMALDAAEYRVIHLSLDIAGGVRQGGLTLCMPLPEKGSMGLTMQSTSESDGASGQMAPARAATLSETALNLAATLRISLTQVQMSVQALGQLALGSEIELGQPKFDKIAIQTLQGKTLARGVLGQLDGLRMVRLDSSKATLDPAASFQMDNETQKGEEITDVMSLDLDPSDDSLSEFNTGSGQAELPELPALDLPELPDLPDTDDTIGVPDLPELSDLPDLPDMSDLPEFDDIDDLPKLNTG